MKYPKKLWKAAEKEKFFRIILHHLIQKTAAPWLPKGNTHRLILYNNIINSAVNCYQGLRETFLKILADPKSFPA